MSGFFSMRRINALNERLGERVIVKLEKRRGRAMVQELRLTSAKVRSSSLSSLGERRDRFDRISPHSSGGSKAMMPDREWESGSITISVHGWDGILVRPRNLQ